MSDAAYAGWEKVAEGEDLTAKYGGKPYQTISQVNPSLAGDEPEQLDELWSRAAVPSGRLSYAGWTSAKHGEDLLARYGTKPFQTIAWVFPGHAATERAAMWHRPAPAAAVAHG